jgi:hypothetical protein
MAWMRIQFSRSAARTSVEGAQANISEHPAAVSRLGHPCEAASIDWKELERDRRRDEASLVEPET